MIERSIRDSVAVALAGEGQQSVQLVKRLVAAQGSSGPVWIWGRTGAWIRRRRRS
jgi:hypothetical protein